MGRGPAGSRYRRSDRSSPNCPSSNPHVEGPWRTSLGEQALEKVDGLEIQRPTCDITYAVEGSVRRYLGQWEKAIDLTDTAMRLTAVNKPWYPTIQACSLYMGGRLEQAASTAEAVLEYQPNNLEALLVLAAAQQEMGLERRARATAELIRDRYPAKLMSISGYPGTHIRFLRWSSGGKRT